MSKPNTKTIAVMNHKGGVGKTTTVFTLAQCLAYLKYKVLVIDLDPQDGNVSRIFNAEKEDIKSAVKLFEDNSNNDICIQDTIQTVKLTPDCTLDVIAANGTLASVLSNARLGVEFSLRDRLEELPDDAYDFILIDTPPTDSKLTVSALIATDYVIIPTEADDLSCAGVERICQSINKVVRKHFNPNIQILGILITRYRSNTLEQRKLKKSIEEVAQQNDTTVFKSPVHVSVAIQEAAHKKEPIFSYKKENPGVIDCMKFAVEVVQMLN